MARPRCVLLVVGLVLTGCVGPARTQESYREKAANSAEATISTVETAMLTFRLSSEGRTLSRYRSLVLSEAEAEAGAVADAFDAVQPPGGNEMDELRTALSSLLSEAKSVIAEMRVAAYRNDDAALAEAADRLPDIRRRLDPFMGLEPT